MNNKNTELLGSMDVKKALIKLSIPATIGMLVNATYNLVDSLFVGWGAGEIAIGALTLAFPIQMIVYAVALMIGIGGASVFSRAYGRNDPQAMHNTINTAVRFGLFSGIIISTLGLVFLDDLLAFFGATPDNIGYAQDYLGIILFGVTFQTLSMILNNFTRAEGRANRAMVAMVLATGLNLILDPFFIFDWGLGLGVSGAAIATVISQVVSFSYITYYAFHKESILTITFKKFFHLDKTALINIIKIGLPTFVRNSIGAFLVILIINLIGEYTAPEDTSIYISIYGVINRVLMFILMPGFGVVQGLAPLAGYNFGAKKWERLVEVIKFTIKILVAYFIGGFLFIQFGAEFIFDIFSKTDNIQFIQTGSSIFRIVSLGFVFIALQILAASIYQAFGYAKRAILISLSRQFIFFLPIAFILVNVYELDGLWYTFAIADALSGTAGLLMLRYELKVLKSYTSLPIEQ